jgi:hypothetical protein
MLFAMVQNWNLRIISLGRGTARG